VTTLSFRNTKMMITDSVVAVAVTVAVIIVGVVLKDDYQSSSINVNFNTDFLHETSSYHCDEK